MPALDDDALADVFRLVPGLLAPKTRQTVAG